MHSRLYYIYILTNQRRSVLYTGVTNDLKQRIIEHWTGCDKNNSFTSKYRTFYLLHYECFQYISDAIAREKEIRNWTREKKMQLINKFNPELKFLNEKLFGNWPPKQVWKGFWKYVSDSFLHEVETSLSFFPSLPSLLQKLVIPSPASCGKGTETILKWLFAIERLIKYAQ